MNHGMFVLLPVLASGLIGIAGAASPFERGIRATLGPSLPYDADAPTASTPSATMPPAAERATGLAREAVEMVDPSMRSQWKRPEMVPNKTKNPGGGVVGTQSPTDARPASTPSSTMPPAAERASALARDAVEMVDPSMRGRSKRQETLPNKAKNAGGGGAATQAPSDARSASTPSSTMPPAAERATALARDAMEMVDPSMRSRPKRQEMDPNKAKDSGGGVVAAPAPTAVTNRQEQKVGPGAENLRVDDASRAVNQVQRGLFNEQKANVGTTQ